MDTKYEFQNNNKHLVPIDRSKEKYICLSDEEIKKTKFDQFMVKNCQLFHQSLNEKYKAGLTEFFKDERYVQSQFYEIICSQLSPTEKSNVKLEYPHPLLQVFKQTNKGSPRKIDLVILSQDEQVNNMLLALEMKLSSNTSTIISDVIRLTYLRYNGQYGQCFTDKGGSRVCMVLLVGDAHDVGDYHLTSGDISHNDIVPYLVKEDDGINVILGSYVAVLLYDSGSSKKKSIKLWKICLPEDESFIIPASQLQQKKK